MTQTIEQLQARVAKLEAENARLNRSNSSYASLTKAQESQLTNLRQRLYQLKGADSAIASEREANNMLTEQLLLAQAEIKRLRDALIGADDYIIGPTAWTDEKEAALISRIQEALAQPSDTSALDAYVAEKVKEAQIECAAKLYRGLRDQVVELTRQRDLAVEMLSGAANYIDTLGGVSVNYRQALSAIKENEGK